jgi:hypothetical protein
MTHNEREEIRHKKYLRNFYISTVPAVIIFIGLMLMVEFSPISEHNTIMLKLVSLFIGFPLLLISRMYIYPFLNRKTDKKIDLL